MARLKALWIIVQWCLVTGFEFFRILESFNKISQVTSKSFYKKTWS